MSEREEALTDEEIDEIVTAEAGDASAWLEPLSVHPQLRSLRGKIDFAGDLDELRRLEMDEVKSLHN